jgi:hypothetical protein
MKKLLPLLLALAASAPSLAGTLQPGGMLTGQNYWPGLKVGIGWSANGLSPSTKIKVTLLRNGAPLRVLGSGLALTNDNPGQSPQQAYQLGGIWWTPTVGDIGCNYAALVATEDGSASFTSHTFGVFAAMNFPTKGAPSNVRVDEPKTGSVFGLGHTGVIAWSLIADPKLWPSRKIKLELFFGDFKVGDIAEIPLEFRGCPASGSYTWQVGALTAITNFSRIPDEKNLIPGSGYWIRASGDGSSYFGEPFVIAGTLSLPTPGTTPVHKVIPAGVTAPGKPVN